MAVGPRTAVSQYDIIFVCYPLHSWSSKMPTAVYDKGEHGLSVVASKTHKEALIFHTCSPSKQSTQWSFGIVTRKEWNSVSTVHAKAYTPAGPVYKYHVFPCYAGGLDAEMCPRICGDFRVAVNTVMTAENHSLPLIDDPFLGLTGRQKFSKYTYVRHISNACGSRSKLSVFLCPTAFPESDRPVSEQNPMRWAVAEPRSD